MYYLGQTVAHSLTAFAKKEAAVIVGYTNHFVPIVHRLDSGKQLKKNDQVYSMDIYPIRVKTALSPSGHQILKGDFYKQGVIAPITIALNGDYNGNRINFSENDEALTAYLQTIQKILDNQTK